MSILTMKNIVFFAVRQVMALAQKVRIKITSTDTAQINVFIAEVLPRDLVPKAPTENMRNRRSL
jgi:hypothetical protein